MKKPQVLWGQSIMDIKLKRHLLLFAKIIISISLLIWLLYDMHWQPILTSIKSVPFWGWLTALGLYLFAQLLSSLRWQLISHTLKLPGSLSFFTRLYFLGMFFNLFMPTSVGGDVVKSYWLGKTNNSQLNAVYSILFDRLSGLVALLLICALALLTIDFKLERISEVILLCTALSFTALLLAPTLLQLVSKIVPKIDNLVSPIKLLYQKHSFFWLTFALAALVQATGIVIIFLLGYLLDIKLSLAFYTISWTLITLITLLPLSINGIGIREAAFVYLFSLRGISDEQALVLSLLSFSIPVIASLFGIFPFIRGHQQLTPAAQ